MKGAKRYMNITLMIFPKKNIWGKWTIWDLKMMHGYNSGSTLRIFLEFCTIK